MLELKGSNLVKRIHMDMTDIEILSLDAERA